MKNTQRRDRAHATTRTLASKAGKAAVSAAPRRASEAPPAPATMPPPSETRVKAPPGAAKREINLASFRELREVIEDLGVVAQENTSEGYDRKAACDRAAQLTGEAFYWIREAEKDAVAAFIAAPPATVMAEPVSAPTRRRYAEEAALGDFDPFPRYDSFEDASPATLLVQSIAGLYGDEPLPGGLDQLASELTVFASYVANGGDLSDDIVHDVVIGYERRIRVLATIARKTLRALEGRPS